MLYVYGIVDSHGFESIPSEGHESGDIVAVPFGTLSAAVSALLAHVIEATPQSIWRHEDVLERLMRDHTVLPLRFGTTCRDADSLRECLLSSAEGLAHDLERVRGKVELALRIVEDAGSRSASATNEQERKEAQCIPVGLDIGEQVGRGVAHLRRRQLALRGIMAREDRGRRMRDLLRQDLDDVLSDVICLAQANSSESFLVSCLVERSCLGAFADALDRFRRDHPLFAVSCTGPWAPYSFAAAPVLSMSVS